MSSSGMNSATTMLLALVPDGGHIVTTTDCYRRTRQFIQTVLPRMGISVSAQSFIRSARDVFFNAVDVGLVGADCWFVVVLGRRIMADPECTAAHGSSKCPSRSGSCRKERSLVLRSLGFRRSRPIERRPFPDVVWSVLLLQQVMSPILTVPFSI